MKRLWITVSVATTLLGASLLGACTAQLPPAKLVVLSAPATSQPPAPIPGRASVLIHRVSVPEYLDGYDIVSRTTPHLLETEANHKWAEKLPDAITRAIRTRFVADGVPLSDPADYEVVIEIDSFEPLASGPATLSARWQVLDGSGDHSERAHGAAVLTAAIPGGETGQAEAMESAVLDLAGRIEATVPPHK